MKKYSIDFYQQISDDYKNCISFSMVIKIIILTSSILFGFYLLTTINLYYNEKKAKYLQENKIVISQQLDKLKNDSKQIQTNLELKENLMFLEELSNNHDAMLLELQSKKMSYQNGYAKYFVALSETVLEDLIWLRNFKFKKGDSLFEIAGNNKSASALQEFIKRLKSHVAFGNKDIKLNKINTAVNDDVDDYFVLNIIDVIAPVENDPPQDNQPNNSNNELDNSVVMGVEND